jgi:hypothetical protein
MNYIENLLSNALQVGAESYGYDMQKSRDYLKKFSFDKRYTLIALSGTCCHGFNERGTVQYMGKAYDYKQSKRGYVVKEYKNYPFLR